MLLEIENHPFVFISLKGYAVCEMLCFMKSKGTPKNVIKLTVHLRDPSRIPQELQCLLVAGYRFFRQQIWVRHDLELC